MTYSLVFLKEAKKEWDNISQPVQQMFKKKLKQRLDNPHHPKDKLHGLDNCYKIKLLSQGYRLVYKVFEDRIIVQVIAVGVRDKLFVYRKAASRV